MSALITARSNKRNFNKTFSNPTSPSGCRSAAQKRCRITGTLTPPRSVDTDSLLHSPTGGRFGSHRMRNRPPLNTITSMKANCSENLFQTENNQDNSAPFVKRQVKTQTKTQYPEMLFTVEQVKSIVTKALQEKELQLRAEYDIILEKKLNEQYKAFMRHTEDQINRQMAESTYNYMC